MTLYAPHTKLIKEGAKPFRIGGRDQYKLPLRKAPYGNIRTCSPICSREHTRRVNRERHQSTRNALRMSEASK